MSCIFTSRRQFLAGSAAFFAWAGTPKLARAEGRDPRFLTIVLRGALDGLATVAPVGDPDWISARGDLALTANSKTPALKLTDFYALHPSMPNLHRMFHAGHATVVHATSSAYRDRSHFDGQDVLESGFVKTERDIDRLAQSRAGGAGDGRNRQGIRARRPSRSVR